MSCDIYHNVISICLERSIPHVLMHAIYQFLLIFSLPVLPTFVDNLSNVTVYGVACIPVTLCEDNFTTSRIILSNTPNHLNWNTLAKRSNVNLTHDRTNNKFSICFHGVNESFVFLEYCLLMGNWDCDSTFCCKTWAEFISRTQVNVAGDSSKLIT